MDCNATNCPVVATIDMIGGKYKAIILWHLIEEDSPVKRFGELQRLIPQATQKMLTQQLRELEKDNLVIRTVYPVVPPKVEYSLSDLGQSIKPILYAMCDWGTDYMKKSGIDVNCFMAEGKK
ncbi:MAG: helix-turn-helix transcriptional regulator [Oscillospiraceae bacterium]|nr:helix-turn-helix transcriptional regulator [Oscillospiraceae bacterium]